MPPTRNWTGEVLLWTQIMGMRPLMAAIPMSRKLSISATVSAMVEGIAMIVVIAKSGSFRPGKLGLEPAEFQEVARAEFGWFLLPRTGAAGA